MPQPDRSRAANAQTDSRPFPDFASAAAAVLGGLHKQLGFDLWLFTRTEGDDWTVLQAHDRGYGVKAGRVFRWADSVCCRMVQGLGPRIAPNIAEVAAYFDAPLGRLLPIGAYLGVPILNGEGKLFGTLCAVHPSPMPGEVADYLPVVELSARLLATLLAADLRADEEARIAEWALAEATTDGLTGLHNRRGWDTLLAAEDARCRRYGHAASVVVVDLDNLKMVNDTEGHPAGDALLCRMAKILKEAARDSDAIARVGGDEFALLAPETDLNGVEAMVQRIRTKLDAANVLASVGVASRDPERGLAAAWEQADATMFATKRKRRESGVIPVAATRVVPTPEPVGTRP